MKRSTSRPLDQVTNAATEATSLLQRAASGAVVVVHSSSTEAAANINQSVGSLLAFTLILWWAVAFIGAALFHSLEYNTELEQALANAAVENSAGRNGTTNVMNTTQQIASLNALIDDLRAHCIQQPPALQDPKWTAAGSLFFSLQLMTTVGYGVFAPATTNGRTAVILFGIVGIVVSSIFIGIITEAIDSLLNRLHVRWNGWGIFSLGIFKVVATTVLLIAYSLLFALVTSADTELLTGYWESTGIHIPYEAEVGRSLYFFFVTVSSIGFGDVTMRHDTVGIVILQYILFIPGMALFSQFTSIGIEYARKAAMERRGNTYTGGSAQ